MSILFLFPIFLQGLVVFIDEFYFHHQRGLPRWERFGHPLDTLSYLACFLFTLFTIPSRPHVLIYVGLCALSCLFITKDEFVHSEKCTSGEHWMHSLLFVLHPISLFCFYQLWLTGEFRDILFLQSGIVTAFMFYQFIFWHFFGKRDDARN